MTPAISLQEAVRLHQEGQLAAAERGYRAILAADPQHADALHLLGVVHHQQGDHAGAEELIGRAMRLSPPKATYLNNYGTVLHALCQYQEALGAFRQALALRPRYADALSNLGMTEAALGRHEAALAHYQEALAIQPQHRDALKKLALLLQRLGRPADAAGLLRQALRLNPADPAAHFNLGSNCQELYDDAEAARHLEEAARLSPERPFWRLRAMTCLPSVFPDAEALDAHRERLEAALDRWGAAAPAAADGDALVAAGVFPGIMFAYHGRDNRRLKEKFASLYAPYFREQPPPSGSGRPDRPRIGFVVTQRHEGLFLRCLNGILEHLNCERFEPVILCSHGSVASLRQGLRRQDLRIVSFGALFHEAVRCIREVACDLLYYWEIGTDPMNYFLPFVRLAPVQCTSWASVLTTGIPTVDYFLSSEWVETPSSDAQYTERLWRSRTLFLCEKRLPAVPPGRVGLPDDRHLYVCFQNPLKLHPETDPLFGQILEADPKGLIVLAARHGRAAELLRQRFARRIPRVADRVVFLSWLEKADYDRVLQAADVILDPPQYGAGSSCYDVFSFNQPMITVPGEFITGRIAWGFCKKMQVPELIAGTPTEYVAKAVRVATDRDYRRLLKERLAQSSGALFDDRQAVAEHERFFEETLAARSPR